MALHAMWNAREAGLDERIGWMVGQSCSALVAGSGLIDEIIVVDDRAIFSGNRRQKLQAVLFAAQRAARFNPARISIGHSHRLYQSLTALISPLVPRTSFGSRSFASTLNSRNHCYEYFRLISGKPDVLPARDFSYFQYPEQSISRKTSAPSDVMLFPGGAKNLLRDDSLRRWPLDNYSELAASLIRANLSVSIGGGATDAWVRPAFSGLSVRDEIAAHDLLETLAILQQTTHVVTHDSGPLHLATLTRTKTCALFGPVNPHARIVEQAFNGRIFWNPRGLVCAPCYDGRDFPSRCQSNACLSAISPQQVASAILDPPSTAQE